VGVPGDASETIPVRLAVFNERGAPDSDAAVVLTASAGQISEAEYEGDGIYLAQYRPPNSATVESVALKASLEGETEQVDEVSFQVVPARPESVVITATPETLAGTKDVQLCVQVKGPGNLSLN
jgi:hypothetical protein